MSKYIKLEDAIKEAKAWSMYYKDDLVSRLENLPSREIVRCIDCKYCEEIDAGGAIICGLCGKRETFDYCSYGERKE